MQVQSGMQDQQLPPDSANPKSAAEIMARVKQLSQDHAGAYGRLVQEIVIPVVKRVLELLYDAGAFKGQRITIDQLLVTVKVTSPLANAAKARQAQAYLNWVQMALALDPTGGLARQVTPLGVGLAEVGADMGVENHLINPQSVQNDIQTSIAQGVQMAMQQLAKQKQAQQNPPPAPAANQAVAA